MGTLRTLLALGIVFGHMGASAPLSLVGGGDAVRVFYMISGYLMSLVLVEGRAYANVRSFYLSRLLRLLPIYLVVAGVSLLVYWAIDYREFWSVYASADLIPRTVLVLSNLFIVGQAQVMFLAVIDSQLVYPSSFALSEVSFWPGLIVPPAWTLELELAFYALAPFLLLRRTLMLSVLLGSLMIKAGLVIAGIGLLDPWSYRFFPTELPWFMAGALAHQILSPRYDAMIPAEKKTRLSAIALGVVVVGLMLLPQVDTSTALGSLLWFGLLYGCVLVLLPLLLHVQNTSRIDAKIGELSYPIYLCHWLPIMVLPGTLLPANVYGSIAGQLWGVTGVILTAWLLNRLVARPVERIRKRLRANGGCAQNEGP